MSSVDILEASPPEVPGAMQAADVPDALLNQLMDQHDAVNQLQNLQLQSGSGSQGTDTEGAIPHQQGTCSPASPSNFTETMDDSDHTYAPSDEDEEDSSCDSVEFIAETQVQEEEVQSTQLAPLEASQMLESHQESAAVPVRDPSEDLGDADIDAEIEREQQEIQQKEQRIRDLQQRKAARRPRQEQEGPEPRNVCARVSPEGGAHRQSEQQSGEAQPRQDTMFVHPSSEEPQQQEQQPRESTVRPRRRQGTIDAFVRNVRNVQQARPQARPPQRRLSAHPERADIPRPQNEQELYDQWLVPRERSTLLRQQQMDAPFRERLRECGMVETQIEADGNCQFRALADQLFVDQECYAECRAAAINQLRSEPDRYREFITEDWETYVSRMENDGEWGDNIPLQAAADYYEVTAHVYSHDPEIPFPLVLPSKHLDADRIIGLSHEPELHYNSVHSNSA